MAKKTNRRTNRRKNHTLDKIILCNIASSPKKNGINGFVCFYDGEKFALYNKHECFLCKNKNIYVVGKMQYQQKFIYYGLCKQCFSKNPESAQKIEDMIYENPEKYLSKSTRIN